MKYPLGSPVLVTGGIFDRVPGVVKERIEAGPMRGRYLINVGALGDVLVREREMALQSRP